MSDWHPGRERGGDQGERLPPQRPDTMDHAPAMAVIRNGYEAEPGPAQEGEADPPSATDAGKERLLIRQVDRWIAGMERLRLSDYVRYVSNRKRMFWDSFWGGMARGVGMAVGFTILGAVLVIILQNLAKRNLPLIGDVLAEIVSIVQKRLE